jgi:hypothetical protein
MRICLPLIILVILGPLAHSQTHLEICKTQYKKMLEPDFYLDDVEAEGGMVKERSLSDWRWFFKEPLMDKLDHLKATDHVMGFGSGDALAEASLALKTDAKVTAIAPEFKYKENQSHIKNLELVENYFEHIPPDTLKPFDVGVDLFGITTYTKDVSGYFNTALQLMKDNGAMFVHDISDRTRIYAAPDSKKFLTVVQWLMQQKNVQVKILNKSLTTTTFEITKTGPVNLPTLQLEEYVPGIPPIRRFHQINP